MTAAVSIFGAHDDESGSGISLAEVLQECLAATAGGPDRPDCLLRDLRQDVAGTNFG
jgi:hypothetical protein